MLRYFVIMTCLLLYFGPVLQTWPNTEALESLALTAIDLIMRAHIQDSLEAPEQMVHGLLGLVSKWVASEVRNHLEEILLITRGYMDGFGLSDSNDMHTNQRNFRAAIFLSTYLHLHHIPRSAGQRSHILYAYMNPVLIQVIRQAYYASTTSMARMTYLLFKTYPSLRIHIVVCGYNWTELPLNAFVMGAVAIRQALREWSSGGFDIGTWTPSARDRFARIRRALTCKVGSYAYFKNISVRAGRKFYNDLRLGQVPKTTSDTASDAGSDRNYDIPDGSVYPL